MASQEDVPVPEPGVHAGVHSGIPTSYEKDYSDWLKEWAKDKHSSLPDYMRSPDPIALSLEDSRRKKIEEEVLAGDPTDMLEASELVFKRLYNERPSDQTETEFDIEEAEESLADLAIAEQNEILAKEREDITQTGFEKAVNKWLPKATSVLGAGLGGAAGSGGGPIGAAGIGTLGFALGHSIGKMGSSYIIGLGQGIRDIGSLIGDTAVYYARMPTTRHVMSRVKQVDGMYAGLGGNKGLSGLTGSTPETPALADAPAYRDLIDVDVKYPYIPEPGTGYVGDDDKAEWRTFTFPMPERSAQRFFRTPTNFRLNEGVEWARGTGQTIDLLGGMAENKIRQMGRNRLFGPSDSTTYPTNRAEYELWTQWEQAGYSLNGRRDNLLDHRRKLYGDEGLLSEDQRRAARAAQYTPSEARAEFDSYSKGEKEKFKSEWPIWYRTLLLRSLGRSPTPGLSFIREGLPLVQPYKYTEAEYKDELAAEKKAKAVAEGREVQKEEHKDVLKKYFPKEIEKQEVEAELDLYHQRDEMVIALGHEVSERILESLGTLPGGEGKRFLEMVHSRKGALPTESSLWDKLPSVVRERAVTEFILKDLPNLIDEIPEAWADTDLGRGVVVLWSANWGLQGKDLAVDPLQGQKLEELAERAENDNDAEAREMLKILRSVLEAAAYHELIKEANREVRRIDSGESGVVYGHADVSDVAWANLARLRLANPDADGAELGLAPGPVYASMPEHIQEAIRYYTGDPNARIHLTSSWTKVTGPGQSGLDVGKTYRELFESRLYRLESDNKEMLLTLDDASYIAAWSKIDARAHKWADEKLKGIINMSRGKLLLWRDEHDPLIMNNPHVPGWLKAIAAVYLPISSEEQPYWGTQHTEIESPFAYAIRAGFPVSTWLGAWVRGVEEGSSPEGGGFFSPIWGEAGMSYMRGGSNLIHNVEIGKNFDNAVRMAHYSITGAYNDLTGIDKPGELLPESRGRRMASHVILSGLVMIKEPSAVGLALGVGAKASQIGRAATKNHTLKTWTRVLTEAEKLDDPMEAVAYLNKELNNVSVTDHYLLEVMRRQGLNEKADASFLRIQRDWRAGLEEIKEAEAAIAEFKAKIGSVDYSRTRPGEPGVVIGGTVDEVPLVLTQALEKGKLKVLKSEVASAALAEATAVEQLNTTRLLLSKAHEGLSPDEIILPTESWNTPFTRPFTRPPVSVVPVSRVESDLALLAKAIEKDITLANKEKSKSLPLVKRLIEITADMNVHSEQIAKARSALKEIGASTVLTPKKKRAAVNKQRAALTKLVTAQKRSLKRTLDLMKKLEPAEKAAAKRYRNIRGLKAAQARTEIYKQVVVQMKDVNEARVTLLNTARKARAQIKKIRKTRKDIGIPSVPKGRPKKGAVSAATTARIAKAREALKEIEGLPGAEEAAKVLAKAEAKAQKEIIAATEGRVTGVAKDIVKEEKKLATATAKVDARIALAQDSKEVLKNMASDFEKSREALWKLARTFRKSEQALEDAAYVNAFSPPGITESLSRWMGRVIGEQGGKLNRAVTTAYGYGAAAWVGDALQGGDVVKIAQGLDARISAMHTLASDATLTNQQIMRVMALWDTRAAVWGTENSSNPLLYWASKAAPELVITTFDDAADARRFLEEYLQALGDPEYLLSVKDTSKYKTLGGKYTGSPKIQDVDVTGLTTQEARQAHFDVDLRGPAEEGRKLGPKLGREMRQPEELVALKERLLDLTSTGLEGRYWYRIAGEGILELAGGDLDFAHKIAAVISELSPQKSVRENVRQAVAAINRMQKGLSPRPVIAVLNEKTTVAKVVRAWDDAVATGQKVGPFKDDLIRYIDKRVVSDAPTIDAWVLKAFGITGGPTPSEIRFVTNVIGDLRDELNLALKAGDPKWTNDQVQAAMWVATRKLSPEFKSTANYDILAGMRDTGLWQVIETMPGDATGHLTEAWGASWGERLVLHAETMAALRDNEGRDVIAKALGALTIEETQAIGLWEHAFNPGTAVLLAVGRKGSEAPQELSASGQQIADMYAAIYGVLLRQKGAGWHTRYAASGIAKKNSNGVRIDLKGRMPTQEEVVALSNGLDVKWGEASDSTFIAGTPDGLHIVNLEYGTDAYKAIKNIDFQRDVNTVANKVFGKDIETPANKRNFMSQTEYNINDWGTDLNGEGYLRWVEERHGAEARRTVEDILRRYEPEVHSAQARVAKKYGWTTNDRLGAEWRKEASAAASAAAIGKDSRSRTIGLNRPKPRGDPASPRPELPEEITLGELQSGSLTGNIPIAAQQSVFEKLGQRIEYDAKGAPVVDPSSIKIYPLQDKFGKTYEEVLATLEEWTNRKGTIGDQWKFLIFGPKRNPDGTLGPFVPPDFANLSYHNKHAWLFQPWEPKGSFYDAAYTLAWRASHEVAHGIVNEKLTRIYGGQGVRDGALGVAAKTPKGNIVEPLTLPDALRALDWEDEAFKLQRRILEEDFGIKITDEQFAQEYALNMADAALRVLTGQFSSPGAIGVRAVAVDPAKALAEAKELVRRAAQEMGLDLSTNFLKGEAKVAGAIEEALPSSSPKVLLEADEVSIKGATVFPLEEDAKTIIHLFKYKDDPSASFDIRTLLHELGHVFRRDLTGKGLKAAEDWAEKALIKARPRPFGVRDPEDGSFIWTREAEELYVEEWLRWLGTGKAPSRPLESTFVYFSKWLRNIYGWVGESYIVDPKIEYAFESLLKIKKTADPMERVYDQGKLSRELDLRYGRETVMKFIEEAGGPEGRVIEKATGRAPSLIPIREEGVAFPEGYNLGRRYLSDPEVDGILSRWVEEPGEARAGWERHRETSSPPARSFDKDNPGAAEWRERSAHALRDNLLRGNWKNFIRPYPWKGKDISGIPSVGVEQVLQATSSWGVGVAPSPGRWRGGPDAPRQLEAGVVMPARESSVVLKPAREFPHEQATVTDVIDLQGALDMLDTFAKSHIAQREGLLTANTVERKMNALLGPSGGKTGKGVFSTALNIVRRIKNTFHPDISRHKHYHKNVYEAMNQFENMLDRASHDAALISTWSRDPLETLIEYVSTTESIKINRYDAGEYATAPSRALAVARTVARPNVVDYTWMNVSDKPMFTQFREWAMGYMGTPEGIAELKGTKIIKGMAEVFKPTAEISDELISGMQDFLIRSIPQHTTFESLRNAIQKQTRKETQYGGFGGSSSFFDKELNAWVDFKADAKMIDQVIAGAMLHRFTQVFRRAVGGNISVKEAKNVTDFLSGNVGKIRTEKEYQEVLLTLERLGMPGRNIETKVKPGKDAATNVSKELVALNRAADTSVFMPRHLFEALEKSFDRFTAQRNVYHEYAPTMEGFPKLLSVASMAKGGRVAKINMTVGALLTRPWYLANDWFGNNNALFLRRDGLLAGQQAMQNLPGYFPFYGKWASLAMSQMSDKVASNVPILRPMMEAMYDPHLSAIWQGKAGVLRAKTGAQMTYNEARQHLTGVAIETVVAEELMDGVKRWTRSKPALAAADDTWQRWTKTQAAKGYEGAKNMQGDVYDHVQWAQQQQRAYYWLHVWKQTGDTRQADQAVKDAFYAWKHGFAQIEAGFLAQFNIPFYRWWRLAAFQGAMAFAEPFVKTQTAPGKLWTPYMTRALYSGNEIDQWRKWILLQQGLPFWYSANYGTEQEATRDALEAHLALRVPKWLRQGTYPYVHDQISPRLSDWYSKRGRPGQQGEYTDVATVFSPSSATDPMRMVLALPSFLATLGVFMYKASDPSYDPFLIPEDWYQTGIIDPIMSFTGPFVQTVVAPTFLQYLDPLASKVYPSKRLSVQEAYTWKAINKIPYMPENMGIRQDGEGNYVQNPLVSTMLRLFIPQYASNIPMAVRTALDSPYAGESWDRQLSKGFRHLTRAGVEYPYNPRMEMFRETTKMNKRAQSLIDAQKAKTTKATPQEKRHGKEGVDTARGFFAEPPEDYEEKRE